MTVEMLIRELQSCNPKSRVILHDHRLGSEVLFVISYLNGRPTTDVILECEDDVDLTNELREQINQQKAHYEKELYSRWIKTGITPEMVERNLGKEAADHMKEVCEEHGLI